MSYIVYELVFEPITGMMPEFRIHQWNISHNAHMLVTMLIYISDLKLFMHKIVLATKQQQQQIVYLLPRINTTPPPPTTYRLLPCNQARLLVDTGRFTFYNTSMLDEVHVNYYQLVLYKMVLLCYCVVLLHGDVSIHHTLQILY